MAEKVASFRLKEYKINKASIEFDPDKPLSKMSIEIERKGDIEENNIYRINMYIGVSDETNNFKISANMVALFEFDSEISEENKTSFVNSNAPAILFPYFRAYISTLTSLSGMQPVILQTINFARMLEQQEK